MKHRFSLILVFPALAVALYSWGVFVVGAQTQEEAVASDELYEISEEMSEKRARIDQINRKIDAYNVKIEQKQAEGASLAGEVELLENRIAKSELEIEATQQMMAVVDEELSLIGVKIAGVQATQDRQREILKGIIQEMNVSDDQSLIEILFGHETFSAMFDELEYLEMVNADLRDTLEEAKRTEASLRGLRTQEESKRAFLGAYETQVKETLAQLDEERSAKEVLIAQTQASEAQFASLLYELREEQQYINQQIAALQADLEQRLYENDIVGDSSVLSWPVDPVKGISSTFRDPSYPYRHLFEHSGVDIPVDVGTPVTSAAPGYVAWTREGRLYGYYVMVVHTNGIATLYAHLSKILVETDQFVSRGTVLGLSGGRPGLAGAGLSTGPHLHFEVRKDGIPTNPLGYLIEQ